MHLLTSLELRHMYVYNMIQTFLVIGLYIQSYAVCIYVHILFICTYVSSVLMMVSVEVLM